MSGNTLKLYDMGQTLDLLPEAEYLLEKSKIVIDY